MIRGTTAGFKFKLPYEYEQVGSVKIIFRQDHNNGPSASRPLPITKTKAHCYKVDVKELGVKLTPEETLRFSDERKAYVQLFAIGPEGEKFGSHEEMFTVYPGSDEDVSNDNILPTPGNDGLIILDGGRI
jgi:hypothetical protein